RGVSRAVVVDQACQGLGVLRQAGGPGALQHQLVGEGADRGPDLLDLAQEDARAGRADAVEGLQQFRDAAGIALRLVPQPAEVTLPAVEEQCGGVIEAGRGALVVAPVPAAAEGVDTLLPRALAQVAG